MIRLLVVIFFATFIFQVHAQYNYTTNADGTLTITGYTGPGGNITLPTSINGLTVSGVGFQAMAEISSLTSLTIPGTITNFGQIAFVECENLTNVVIGNGITSLGDEMFQFCRRLSSVTVPTNLTNFGNSTFYGSALTSFVVPPGVTSLQAVFGDSPLTNIVLPIGLTNIDGAFDYCTNLPTVILPPTLTSIGDTTFDGCSNLTSIVIPNSVTSIGNQSFTHCASLGSITIPASVTNIGAGSVQGGTFGPFVGCTSLTNITILGVPNIGTYACFELNSLKNLYLEGGAVGDYAFEFCTNLTNLTFGKLPISLGTTAFFGCPISSLYLPSNVISLSDGSLTCALTNLVIAAGVTQLADFSFIDNGGLKNILMLGNAPYVPYGGDQGPFEGCPATVYYLPGTTGWSNSFGSTVIDTAGTPTALWNPGIQNHDGQFGLKNGLFGFNVTNGGPANIPISILACTNLLNPVWTTVTNVMLTNSYYFTHSQSANFPSRFYGIGFP